MSWSQGGAGGERRGVSWRERRSHGGGEVWVKADRRGVGAAEGFTRLTVFVIDFDKLHFGELLEVFHERARDVVERAIRLASARQIHMCYAITKDEFAITSETVENQCESLIPFDIARPFEKFIEHRA